MYEKYRVVGNLPGLIKVGLVTATALLVNVPLGRWRSRVKKFSFWWFLAVHLSVPFIIFLRVETGISAIWIPFTVGFAVLGQYLGGSFTYFD